MNNTLNLEVGENILQRIEEKKKKKSWFKVWIIHIHWVKQPGVPFKVADEYIFMVKTLNAFLQGWENRHMYFITV